MSDSTQADVIVPVYRDTAMTIRCLESVLAARRRDRFDR